jgi:hypothetical protein
MDFIELNLAHTKFEIKTDKKLLMTNRAIFYITLGVFLFDCYMWYQGSLNFFCTFMMGFILSNCIYLLISIFSTKSDIKWATRRSKRLEKLKDDEELQNAIKNYQDYLEIYKREAKRFNEVFLESKRRESVSQAVEK